MSKAVLVMDMPESCADCSCSFFERDNPKLNLICGATGEDANNVGKPDRCPLIPMPEKIDIHKAKTETVANWIEGWNACIDAITGEREEKDV